MTMQQVEKSSELSNKLLSENPVCQLSGNEFSKVEGKTLHQQIAEYFKSCGDHVSTKFGDVFIDDKGIRSDLNHGMSRSKAVAIAAIKPTLEKGVVILPLEHYNIHGKKQKTGMIAAPIKIKDEKYICIVVVIDNTTTRRLYVHEVFLTKNLLEDVAVSIAVLGAETPVTQPKGEVAKVLKNHIQNTYSKEEISNLLNSMQKTENKTDMCFGKDAKTTKKREIINRL